VLSVALLGARLQDNVRLGALDKGDNLALLGLGYSEVLETRL